MASNADIDMAHMDQALEQYKARLAAAKTLQGQLPIRRPKRAEIEKLFVKMNVSIIPKGKTGWRLTDLSTVRIVCASQLRCS